MGGGPDHNHSSPPSLPNSNLSPRQRLNQEAGQAPFFGTQPFPGRYPYFGGTSGYSWSNHSRGQYHYNPYGGFSGMPPGPQRGQWQEPGNNFNYVPQPEGYPCQGTDGNQEGDGSDPGILVYDNIITGDPRSVIIGQGNRAGGQVRGRISGNRIIRS